MRVSFVLPSKTCYDTMKVKKNKNLERKKMIMKKALSCGILSSLFFAFTFICIRPKKGIHEVLKDIRKQPGIWFIWSTVGFGFFYLPLTLGSVFGESWMTASSWVIVFRLRTDLLESD